MGVTDFPVDILNLYSEDLAKLPEVSIPDYLSRNEEVNYVFDRIRNVKLIDTKNIFCSTITCKSLDESGNILFSDTNHVTEHGARLIVDQIVDLF